MARLKDTGTAAPRITLADVPDWVLRGPSGFHPDDRDVNAALRRRRQQWRQERDEWLYDHDCGYTVRELSEEHRRRAADDQADELADELEVREQ